MSRINREKIKKILVIRYSAYGDIAATFPILKLLRQEFPEAQIDFLISSGYKHVKSIIPFVNRVLEFKVPANLRGFINSFKYLGTTFKQGVELFNNHYDLVIDLQSNNRSLALRLLACAPYSVYCNHVRSDKLSVERYASALEKLGLPKLDASNCPLGYPLAPEIIERVDNYLANKHISKEYLCLAPAGIWPTKLWSLDYYAQLAKMYYQTFQRPVIILGDAKERPRGEEIKKQAGDFVYVTSGDLDLATAIGFLHYANGFVGNDSGLGHYSWTFGVPTVIICGPTDPRWVGPAGPFAKGLSWTQLECIHCHSYQCKRGDFACMKLLTPEFVFSHLKALIEAKNTNKLADKS